MSNLPADHDVTRKLAITAQTRTTNEAEHQTAHDTTVGPAKPLGVRGAVMADTVGAGLP